MQAAKLVPRHWAKPCFGQSAELLIPLAAGGEVIVEHPQNERPVHFLKRLSQLLKVPQKVAFDAPASSHAEQLEQIEHLAWVDLHRSGGQQQQAPRLSHNPGRFSEPRSNSSKRLGRNRSVF